MSSEAIICTSEGDQRAIRGPSAHHTSLREQSKSNHRQSEGNQRAIRGPSAHHTSLREQPESNQRAIMGNQRAIREPSEGQARTIRASESVATGGRFAATVSASSSGAYLMKEAIKAHQRSSFAHSGEIPRKVAHRLSFPTPRARCSPIRPSLANSAVASSPPTRRNA